MNKLTLLIIAVCFSTVLFGAGDGYKITMRLKGNSDTAIILAHYYGSKQYLDDTAFATKPGVFIFTGDEKLKDGMYLVAGQNKTKYFDFFLTDNQQMEFVCDPVNVIKTMQVKGSEDNKAFYSYIKYLSKKQVEIEPFNRCVKENPGNPDSVKMGKAKIEAIDTEVKAYIQDYLASDKGFLSVNFVKANTEPEYLQYITSPDGKVDTLRMYVAYKEHFFDNFVFSDPRLIYTPAYSQKIDFYFDKMVVPVLDSLEKDIDRVMQLASVNTEMQNYTAWYLSLKYETSEVMGHDALFVYIVRKYLETGKVGWQYPEVKDNILKRVSTLEPLLLGKTAPNLILLDTNDIPHSLLNTKARYTLLFFWESNCGHCQKEMSNVLKFYDEFHKKYDMEIFGVSTDTSVVKWKAYIQKHHMPWISVNGYRSLSGDYHKLYDIRSTPIMYLLDEEKKILAKLLLTEELGKLIVKREEVLEKNKKDKVPEK